jgi:hypothetical protein
MDVLANPTGDENSFSPLKLIDTFYASTDYPYKYFRFELKPVK